MEQFTTAAVSSQNPQLIVLGAVSPECHKSLAHTVIIGYYCPETWTHTPIISDPIFGSNA